MPRLAGSAPENSTVGSSPAPAQGGAPACPPRAAAAAFLDAGVEQVRAVSPARAKLLAGMGIRTVRDLLTCYPNRHIDLTCVATCAAAPIGQTVTVVGTVHDVVEKHPRPKLDILEVTLTDDTGMLLGVWFRQPWMARKFERGALVAFSGKVAFEYGYKRMNSPYLEFLGSAEQAPTAAYLPVHPSSEKVSATWMRRFIANALQQAAALPDPLPASLRLSRGLVCKKAALRQIHFPATHEELDAAHARLAYEELLCLQLQMMGRRLAETATGAFTAHGMGAVTRGLYAALPFTLTAEQQAAIDDIASDMCAARCMNRMLLGDVGTGKTIVAAFAIALAADTGCQAALMAPTEVLARQHAESLGPLFDACGLRWGLLTGSTPAAEREQLLAQAASGALCCLIGTHALIEPDVAFARLSLAIIDEQHRFGVAQRAALRAKGQGADLLVMTATPIPRTLALALYGDLDTSYIRTRPANRPDPVTRVISRQQRNVAYDAIRAAVKRGQQAYIICPLVGLSRQQRVKRAEDGQMAASLAGGPDISDAKAAEQEAAYLAAKVFPDMSVGLLTGHMSATEKQAAMSSFSSGATSILVATTVVEVGVDVPNATVMLVEDAERFGLAQLHQLRGRISRGNVAGQAFLVADPAADDEELQARMQTIASTCDGFELAEADLRARREGDVLGRRQHGAAALKLANVVDDAALVRQAHDDARALLAADPQLALPEHAALAHELQVTLGAAGEPDA